MAKTQYYVVDSTKSQNGQNPCIIFETIPGLITYLEGMCQRGFNKTRAKLMESAADTGLYMDDSDGRAFYELMCEYFNIGVIRGNSPARRHIFEEAYNQRHRNELGD